eukprot:CAMPEP_0184397580 /NCGR_PEP_ID=MMETSP0007-20130409/61218_1 /TAXON_ID=97485 /ORGANISM="Prymnesium parvum, Strain Texoma1" /LENGTH=52 /DNA_ID=CAMNT_0026751091 /DNA_START=46 /DNA_END=201 /DNA_ORIENTATION=-
MSNTTICVSVITNLPVASRKRIARPCLSIDIQRDGIHHMIKLDDSFKKGQMP